MFTFEGQRRLRVEERKEVGGSYLAISHPYGLVDAHVGRRDYVTSYSYMYENQGLRAHVEAVVPPGALIAYINSIHVEPEARHAGLGEALMKRMLRDLQERGVVHVYGHMAESKGEAKKRLLQWLARFGFEVVDCCEEDKLPVVALTL